MKYLVCLLTFWGTLGFAEAPNCKSFWVYQPQAYDMSAPGLIETTTVPWIYPSKQSDYDNQGAAFCKNVEDYWNKAWAQANAGQTVVTGSQAIRGPNLTNPDFNDEDRRRYVFSCPAEITHYPSKKVRG